MEWVFSNAVEAAYIRGVKVGLIIAAVASLTAFILGYATGRLRGSR